MGYSPGGHKELDMTERLSPTKPGFQHSQCICQDADCQLARRLFT